MTLLLSGHVLQYYITVLKLFAGTFKKRRELIKRLNVNDDSSPGHKFNQTDLFQFPRAPLQIIEYNAIPLPVPLADHNIAATQWFQPLINFTKCKINEFLTVMRVFSICIGSSAPKRYFPFELWCSSSRFSVSYEYCNKDVKIKFDEPL